MHSVPTFARKVVAVFYSDARLFIAMFPGVCFCSGCGCVPRRQQPSQSLCTGYRMESLDMGGMHRFIEWSLWEKEGESCILFAQLRKEVMEQHVTAHIFSFQSFKSGVHGCRGTCK